jgi:hypothetical protein
MRVNSSKQNGYFPAWLEPIADAMIKTSTAAREAQSAHTMNWVKKLAILNDQIEAEWSIRNPNR